ncbi:MAG: AmmeMemoRadiSam system protein A [Eubacteriales bacterium]|nr:AmmeMemoRadiSam system protein A [Eubacteriales bacterium]
MLLKGAWIVPHPPLIIPEVGAGRQKAIQKTIDAYKKVADQIRSLAPDALVIATPHAVSYRDCFAISAGRGAEGSFADFGAPQVRIKVRYDADLAGEISRWAGREGLAVEASDERCNVPDHGMMIPLYFIREQGIDVPVVRISISGLSPDFHRLLGQCIHRAAEALGRSYVFIASGDLSHKLLEEGPYGLSAEGPVFDCRIRKIVQNGDPAGFFALEEAFCRKAAECGLRGFQIMAGVLEGKSVRSEEVSYEAPFGVGYLVAAYHTAEEKEDPYVALARKSLEHYIRTDSLLTQPEGLPPELTDRRGGVFVSLKIDGQLRGCIGTIQPVRETLAGEILHNAVSAGTEDPRFLPVRERELPLLSYSVDVLSLPEPVTSEAELDPHRYGVIVSFGGRRGLLLPDLEGIDTVEQQLRIALQKAGIDPNQPYRMQRFEVFRHKENV